MAPNRWHDGAKSRGVTDHRSKNNYYGRCETLPRTSLLPPPASHNSPAAALVEAAMFAAISGMNPRVAKSVLTYVH